MASDSHQGGDIASVAQEVRPFLRGGRGYWVLVAALGTLFLLGVVGFALRLAGGTGDRAAWGYYAATFSFLISTAGTAPVVSIALRFAQAHWRRPLARASEAFAAVGILSLLWFIPLLWLVPSARGRQSIWFNWPLAPHLWDTLLVVFTILCGLALLYFSSLPDRAALGRRTPGVAWHGSSRQWRILHSGLIFLGAFYFIGIVGVHFLVSADFAMGFVPGWVDPLFPTYHAVTGLQAGVATVLVTLFLLRRFGGLKKYLELDQFWMLAKILMALTLIWFYFWISGVIVWWYGRRPEELLMFQLLMTGPYKIAFLAAFALNFAAPFFLLLLWNPIRRTIWGPAAAAALTLIGNLLDRIRLYVVSYSVEGSGHVLESVPATRWPGVADILLILGGLGGMALIFLVAARVASPLSLWEVAEGERLKVHRPFLRRIVGVIAKPE